MYNLENVAHICLYHTRQIYEARSAVKLPPNAPQLIDTRHFIIYQRKPVIDKVNIRLFDGYIP